MEKEWPRLMTASEFILDGPPAEECPLCDAIAAGVDHTHDGLPYYYCNACRWSIIAMQMETGKYRLVAMEGYPEDGLEKREWHFLKIEG